MLDVSRQDIETYLFEVKKAIKEGNYRIARNKNANSAKMVRL